MKKLRILRNNKNWSQDQLSKKSNVSQSMICEIENGRTNPSIKILKQLANALGVSVTELLEEEENKGEVTKYNHIFYDGKLSIAN